MHAAHRLTDDRSSEASSVRSSASGNDSLPGSAASSPCDSPQPSSASKWGDGDPGGATSSHPCRYFVVKAANSKMLQTAEQRCIWGTASASDKKIAAAFAVCYFSATHCWPKQIYWVTLKFLFWKPKKKQFFSRLQTCFLVSSNCCLKVAHTICSGICRTAFGQKGTDTAYILTPVLVVINYLRLNYVIP